MSNINALYVDNLPDQSLVDRLQGVGRDTGEGWTVTKAVTIQEAILRVPTANDNFFDVAILMHRDGFESGMLFEAMLDHDIRPIIYSNLSIDRATNKLPHRARVFYATVSPDHSTLITKIAEIATPYFQTWTDAQQRNLLTNPRRGD